MKSFVSFLISGNIVTGASFKENLFSMGWGLHKNYGFFEAIFLFLWTFNYSVWKLEQFLFGVKQCIMICNFMNK